jgi:copper chaperone NosL
MLTLLACSSAPAKLILGKDVCAFCKMTVSDNRFGGALRTPKGKIYLFDDAKCFHDFIKKQKEFDLNMYSLWLVDFSNPHYLIDIHQACLVKSIHHTGPMSGNIIAFSSKVTALNYIKVHGGEEIGANTFLP